MKILVKKLHDEAVLPSRANPTDAGYDIVALDDGIADSQGYIQYRTGLSVAAEKGYHIEIFPRSSISKYDLILANSIGLVDNGYRGEILIRFKSVMCIRHSSEFDQNYATCPYAFNKYRKGDKIAQLVIRKTEDAEFEFVDNLDATERNTGGFGSTGN
jgi:dUTP pyrophosphatase